MGVVVVLLPDCELPEVFVLAVVGLVAVAAAVVVVGLLPFWDEATAAVDTLGDVGESGPKGESPLLCSGDATLGGRPLAPAPAVVLVAALVEDDPEPELPVAGANCLILVKDAFLACPDDLEPLLKLLLPVALLLPLISVEVFGDESVLERGSRASRNSRVLNSRVLARVGSGGETLEEFLRIADGPASECRW